MSFILAFILSDTSKILERGPLKRKVQTKKTFDLAVSTNIIVTILGIAVQTNTKAALLLFG